MSRRFSQAVLLLLISTMTLGVAAAHGYGYSVHFYSTALVAERLNLDGENEWQLLSVCTHLPDESKELAAANVRLGLSPLQHVGWGLLGRVGGERTRRMITVQQLLHGLTGGSAATLSDAVSDILRTLWDDVRAAVENRSGAVGPTDRAERICALGFGLHLLGDSFSHRRLNKARRGEMYSTGRGHFVDGTLPDKVLRDVLDAPRYGVEYWRDYLEVLLRLDDSDASLENEPKLWEVYLDLTAIPADGRRIPNEKAQSLLTDRHRALGIARDWTPDDHKKEPCECYLERLKNSRLLPPHSQLTCRGVWQRFRDAAEPIFQRGAPSLRTHRQVGHPPNGFVDPEFSSSSCGR